MQIIVNKPEFFPPLYARGQCNNNNGEEQQHRDRERKRGRDGETQAKSTKLTAKANCCAFNQKFNSLASLSGRKVIPIGERLGTSHSPALFAACAHTLHSPLSHSHSTLSLVHAHALHTHLRPRLTYTHTQARAHTHSRSLLLSRLRRALTTASCACRRSGKVFYFFSLASDFSFEDRFALYASLAQRQHTLTVTSTHLHARIQR